MPRVSHPRVRDSAARYRIRPAAVAVFSAVETGATRPQQQSGGHERAALTIAMVKIPPRPSDQDVY
jgi:hypothetical protein